MNIINILNLKLILNSHQLLDLLIKVEQLSHFYCNKLNVMVHNNQREFY